jgi:hypothetical protein
MPHTGVVAAQDVASEGVHWTQIPKPSSSGSLHDGLPSCSEQSSFVLQGKVPGGLSQCM